MADYRAISNTETNPLAPVTSALMKALAANPVAIAEGATDATGIRVKALQQLSAGSVVRSRMDFEVSAADSITAPMFSFMQRGSARLYAESKLSDSSTGTFSFFIRRKGVDIVLGTWAAGSSYVGRTVDFDVLPGDTAYAQTVKSGVGAATSYINNMRVMTGGENLYPAPEGVYLENDYA